MYFYFFFVLQCSMASAMYINESQSNGQTGCPTKFASTNSIPAMVEESSILGRTGSIDLSPGILREPKARRHSVLDDLRARRDSLFLRARRGSIFEEKETSAEPEVEKPSQQEKKSSKDKRRGSDGNRRGSVFYVSDDLLEENQQVLALEAIQREEIESSAKKGRRKSWHPLATKPPKTDRKRRKGVAGAPSAGDTGSTEGLYNPRQKRLSWWNIFVPDYVGRYIGQLMFFFVQKYVYLSPFFFLLGYWGVE